MQRQLTISLFIFFIFAGVVSAQSPLFPKKLAIYYGFPSLVNGAAGDLNAATDVFNDYDLVVFGDGLQDSSHPDHANTTTIISNLQTAPNATTVYGYIPIGVTTGNLPIAEIQSRVDDWTSMGVAGIFLDEAGYDFGVTRQRQNDAVNYVHSKGVSAFINAFNPDDVFSPAAEPTFNPTGDATQLGSNDIYLHESFQIILSQFQDPVFWANKSDKAFNYKNQFGTQMATVTTVDPSQPGFDQGKFDYAWWSTLLYGFDAMGWGELFFSAASSSLPFRTRPNPGVIGSAFISPVVHAPPLHTRTTTAGQIEVNTDTHIGQFLPNQPEQAILNLIGDVSNLVDGGALNRGQGRSLTAKLRGALKKVNRGRNRAAIRKLRAFIRQVAVFIRVGILSQPDGQPLIQAARDIIRSLTPAAAPPAPADSAMETGVGQAFPNPTNPEVWIPYRLGVSSEVVIEIHDVAGHSVVRLNLGHQSAGVYETQSTAAYWDGRNAHGEQVPSGLYFYTFRAGQSTSTGKLLIRR
jgi:hypothetical protein